MVKVCLSFLLKSDNSYFFVYGKEIYKFKANNKTTIFPSRLCLGSVSEKFDRKEFQEVSFKETVYDSSAKH